MLYRPSLTKEMQPVLVVWWFAGGTPEIPAVHKISYISGTKKFLALVHNPIFQCPTAPCCPNLSLTASHVVQELARQATHKLCLDTV